MTDTPRSYVCAHGQLARSCQICAIELELAAAQERIAELERERDVLLADAERYRYARTKLSLMLTDDSLFLAGLRLEAYYDTPEPLHITGPLNSFARTAELFDEAMDRAREGK